MIWTYRIFRDDNERYSIREVFYETDGTIIGYGKSPVAVVGESLEELIQMVEWFREAFDLPVLSLAEVDAKIKPREIKPLSDGSNNISLDTLIAELATKTEEAS